MRQDELRSAVSGPTWAGLALVRDWEAEHRNELMVDWLIMPNKIKHHEKSPSLELGEW